MSRLNVCVGYEEMSDKAKLKKIDELLASFRVLIEECPGYNQGMMEAFHELGVERAEVVNRIGRKNV
jgi:hypothetical protein